MIKRTVTYGAEPLGMRMNERHKLGVMELRSSQRMCEVTRMDRWRNEKVRFKVGVREKMSDSVNGKS